MNYSTKDLPADIAVHEHMESEDVIARVSVDRLPEEVREILAGEGIWGAYLAAGGVIEVQTRDGEVIDTGVYL